MTDHTTETPETDSYGWQWLDTTQPGGSVHPIPISRADYNSHLDGNEWDWLSLAQPPRPQEDSPLATRHGRSVWLGLGAALAVAALITGAGILTVTHSRDVPVAAGIATTAAESPATTTAAGSAACAGLAGEVITDSDAAPGTAAGVIAAFESAYYRQRDAAAALHLVASDAGLSREGLAAGIASIPAGTTHCVAITPVAAGAAEVHLAELRPDGQRIDYLQLINLRDTATGLLITRIANRGDS